MPTTDLSRVRASLRVASNKLSTEQICDIVGILPVQTLVAGRSMSRRNANSQKYSQNVCIFETSKSDGVELIDTIESLVSHCETRNISFSAGADITGDIFCGVTHIPHQLSIVLQKGLLERLVNLGLDLVFDLYA